MERCAHKNSLIAEAADSADKKSNIMQLDPWHIQKELIKRAVLLSILYALAQLFGWREWTTALLQGATATPIERIGCVAYGLLYGSFIFLVPIFLIAALLLTIWNVLSRITTAMSRDDR